MYEGIYVICPVWERRDYDWVDAFRGVTVQLDGWKASFEKNGEEVVSEWDRACYGEGEYTGNEEEEEEEADGTFTSDEMEEEKEDDEGEESEEY